jgi:hypothetical protein
MILPTIPAFVTGETSLLHLQQLSSAIQFGTVASYYPVWRFYKNATQAVAAGTLTTMAFGSIAVDTDTVWNANTAMIVTQGYYECEACVPFQANSSGVNDLQLSLQFTAGPNNPHLSAGTTQRFGGAAGGSPSTTSGVDMVLCCADICPVVCYPGDVISVVVYTYYASTTSQMTNLSPTAGWFPPQFSGRWIRTGT